MKTDRQNAKEEMVIMMDTEMTGVNDQKKPFIPNRNRRAKKPAAVREAHVKVISRLSSDEDERKLLSVLRHGVDAVLVENAQMEDGRIITYTGTGLYRITVEYYRPPLTALERSLLPYRRLIRFTYDVQTELGYMPSGYRMYEDGVKDVSMIPNAEYERAVKRAKRDAHSGKLWLRDLLTPTDDSTPKKSCRKPAGRKNGAIAG